MSKKSKNLLISDRGSCVDLLLGIFSVAIVNLTLSDAPIILELK